MRVPLSWLREYVDLPAGATGRDVQAKLISAGLEVETVEQVGAGLQGPLVVGEVLTIEELEGFKKPIRFCTVDVGKANGTGEPQEIVCGARNFAVGDKVVVILPGGVLPGDFRISARKTYGRISHGMICSARELGMGEDHDGIIVLPPEHEAGTDAIELLELRDEVLDIAVTPDRGYCPVAARRRPRGRHRLRAAAAATRRSSTCRRPTRPATRSRIADPAGCDRFTARTVTGVNHEARSPIWLQRRLQKVGMRPISLAVDITNYVMFEVGQPLHAYDRTRLDGPIGVRRAQPGEKLTTLDGAAAGARRRGPASSPTTPGRSAWPASWAAPTPRSPTPARAAAPRSSSRPRTSTRSRSPAPPAGTGSAPRRPAASSAAPTRRPPPPPRSARSTCWCCWPAAPPSPASPTSPRRPRRARSPCPPTTRTGSRAPSTAGRPSSAGSRRSAATSGAPGRGSAAGRTT